ncbi:MAG: phosphatidylserine decarboxylase family protein [Bacteroidia bacterium]|nr:phosphatidylserine decarboxylase family protein [Bacteroidia bacterium]MDW8301835.1 phosphatidylserine decarboxylase family protein [Bacteroidia bacterium]
MIHREGYKTILWATFGLVLVYSSCYFLYPKYTFGAISVACVSTVLWLFVLQFFRNPSVCVPQQSNVVVAPAHGKVVVIEKVMHQGKEWIQVSIFMSPFDVHVNRSPISGVVKKVEYFAGSHRPAWQPKASLQNERTYIEIQNEHILIAMRQIAGAMARRIVCYLKQNETVSLGQEIGFIKFGSRVDVLMPTWVDLQVELNTSVVGGKSVLATYTT